MKKSLLALVLFSVAVFVTTASAQIANITHPANSPYGSIQAAIDDGITVANDLITVGAGTHNGAVTVNKGITIQGVGPTTIITNASGNGITVTANGVTLENLKVANCTSNGIYATNVNHLTLSGVESDNNGSGTLGSGILLNNVGNVGGASSVTNAIANSNHRHGLSIGNCPNGITVSGGTFSLNGQTGDATTGGGIIVYADGSLTTDNVTINGTTTNQNTTAGVYLSCDPLAHVSNTQIGQTTFVTSNDNGSNSGAHGAGGAAGLIYGPCDHTTITAHTTNTDVSSKRAGLVLLGLDASGTNSPSATIVKNSIISGFNDANHPAGTMFVTDGINVLICVNDVDAITNNDLNGFTTGYPVEDALFHKIDNPALGAFRGPGTTIFVTPNSGSINNGINAANGTYNTVQVKDGTYAENVVVNKAITLSGQGANTIIHPSSGNGVDVTIAGVTLENLHIYLNSAFNGTFAPTATNNTFTFRAMAKVFLEGPFSAGSMSTALLTGSLIPLSQPYNVAPFNYAGTETVVSIPANVVDWVLVELRSGTTGATKRGERAAFLKNDGTLLETDGTTGVWESAAVASGYDLTSYVVIRHRNHLAVMSAAGMAMPNASAYDFTTAQVNAYTVGPNPMKDLLGNATVFGMYCGDTDGSGVVDVLDRNNTWNNRNASNLYSGDDTDLSGVVDVLDRNNTWNNRNLTSQVPN